MACSASRLALRPATSAQTRNRSGSPASSSTVWRADAAGAAEDCHGAGDSVLIPTELTHDRSNSASRAANGITASSASSRSSRPPWPGIRRPGILHPEAPLGELSSRSPSWPMHRQHRGDRLARAKLPLMVDSSHAAMRPTAAAPSTTTGRARPGLAGRDQRRQPRAADRPAGEVGADVARPDQQQQENHVGAPGDRVSAQPDEPGAGEGDPREAGGQQSGAAVTAAQFGPFVPQRDDERRRRCRTPDRRTR